MSFEATFTGNCGHDPQTRQFQSGDTVTQVSVGCSQGYFDQSHQWQDQGTLWVDVTLPASVDASQIGKGDRLLVEGPIRQRTYKGKDGKQHSNLSCHARQVAIIPRVQRGNQQSGYQQPSQPQQGYSQQPQSQQSDGWGAF